TFRWHSGSGGADLAPRSAYDGDVSCWAVLGGRVFARHASGTRSDLFLRKRELQVLNAPLTTPKRQRCSRVNNLPISLSHNTELAMAIQGSQSQTLSPTVPKAC